MFKSHVSAPGCNRCLPVEVFAEGFEKDRFGDESTIAIDSGFARFGDGHDFNAVHFALELLAEVIELKVIR